MNPSAHRPSPEPAESRAIEIAVALRKTWAHGYNFADLRRDTIAGLVVGVVALPLSMALAIASGVPPQHGLYTAIVAGFLIAVLGGSQTSVSGPTAAFVVLLAPITSQYGVAGLLIASFMAGAILVLMGVAKLGRLLRFIPHPVTTGFTAGIAVVIATLQLKDFLGIELDHKPEHYLELVAALARSLGAIHGPDFAIGAVTLACLIFWPRVTRKLPPALVALTAVSVIAFLLHLIFPGFTFDTIGSRFSYVHHGQTLPGIPQTPPTFAWPWAVVDPASGKPPLELSLDTFRGLAVPALAIAMLGAIESLLCAVVADGMAGQKHDPDAELIGQGVGNMVAPFFGGFAATAAIARTATSVRAGGRSPVAAIVHALFVLAAVLALAPLLGHVPMASLAALLILVAWNMSEYRHFAHTLRVAPRADVIVLLSCFSLMVLFDMVVAVGVGVTLAALLFMQRMSALTHTRLTSGEHMDLIASLPDDVLLYEIQGPLFFGAAEKAMGAIAEFSGRPYPRAIILYMGDVPVVDMTGLVALQSVIRRVRSLGAMLVLTGVQRQPLKAMEKAGIHEDPGHVMICQTISEAEMIVRLVDPPQAPVPETTAHA